MERSAQRGTAAASLCLYDDGNTHTHTMVACRRNRAHDKATIDARHRSPAERRRQRRQVGGGRTVGGEDGGFLQGDDLGDALA